MRLLRTLGISAVAVLVLASAATAEIFNGATRVDISLTTINPCNGETVQLTGAGTLVAVRNDQGGFHEIFIDSFNLTGVSENGTHYVARSSERWIFNRNEEGVFTLTQRFTVISAGDAPNYVADRVVWRLVADPNGELRVEIRDEIDTRCLA
jgi:hypothetical protein